MISRPTSFLAGLLGAATCGALVLAQEPPSREVPDPAITPGMVASTDHADVCSHAGGTYSQRHRLSQTPETKQHVMAAYNVPWATRGRYEDDHIIPLCLGGSDDVRNRWPQPRKETTWKAADKDRLEAEACRQVCSGHVSLSEAQGWFMPDWRKAYCLRFPDDRRC